MKEANLDSSISMEHFMRRRLERVKEYCSYMPKDNVLDDLFTNDQFSNVDLPLVVDEKNKLIYCEMPKVGSTNWKRVFMKLTNPAYANVPVSEISGGRKYDENGLKKLTDFPAAQRKEMLDTYFKFTMVRNPFERLLSGYRDKGWNGFFPDKEIREGPEREYRLGANSTKIADFDTQDKLGFNAFLDDLILKGPEIGVGGHFGVRTRHWTRYNDICHFCAVNYQMIAKVENVDDEADFILARAGKLIFSSLFRPYWPIDSFRLKKTCSENFTITIWARIVFKHLTRI